MCADSAPATSHRAGEDAASERHEVLNEVVLSRGSNPYLSMIEVRVRLYVPLFELLGCSA